jgi:putative membrane-bound dehydrogenase-like protein
MAVSFLLIAAAAAVVLWPVGVLTAAPPNGSKAPPPPIEVRLDGHTFTLPRGFTVERVAGPPLVDRPIVADLDERGRLYVADSSGSVEKTDIQLQKKPHRIVRLEDTDGDGRYDRRTDFADKMMFPEGAMWLAGSLYVAAPPQIWKLTDTDDDGVADRREVWFDGRTLTGCANDLHGPYRGPDGWIYWCKGAFAKQTYTLSGGKTFTTRASHIFRARPDGTAIEPVMTGGMDNPVDVAFTPGGERIFTTTFFQHPGGGRRDGLIHAIYGGIYGKDHDPIHDADHKWTAPQLMPVLAHMGPAAPCGLHRYESDQLGADAAGTAYRDNLFACQFNLRKVSRHVLRPEGSSYSSQDSDFLASDNHDFHPTDVIEDADGSLLVVDTGGWYKLCCPSSQLVKADVLGAIYRIKRTGAHNVADPRGGKIDWSGQAPAALVELLSDERRMVRQRAIDQLAGRRTAVLTALRKLLTDRKAPASAVEGAVWALCRIDAAEARELVREALRHADENVRQAALHAVSLWRDRAAGGALTGMLASPSLRTRRGAAEALGRIGDPAAAASLLEAVAQEGNDRALDHALIYSLIEIGNQAELSRALDSPNPRRQRAALVALDQIGARLDVKTVIASLNHPDGGLRDAARWIASRHPEWGGELIAYLRGQLHAKQTEAEQTQLVELLSRFAKNDVVQTLLAETVRGAGRSPDAARMALRAIAGAGLKEAPAAWVSALSAAAVPGSPVLSDVLATIRAVTLPKQNLQELQAALAELADTGSTPEIRLAAMAALPGGLASVSLPHWTLLMTHLAADQPLALRGPAADVISQAKLTPPQLSQLAERLPKAGPLEIDRLLAPFAQSADEAVGRKLLAALAIPQVRPYLRVDSVQQRLKKYPAAVQAEAEKLYALINADFGQQQTRLNEAAQSLAGGDIRRGQAVFNSTKAACLACHTIGYVGGKIGPDLTRIGGIRTERDLLESILFPSASFVRSYEPVAVLSASGHTFNGILKKDAPDEIVLIEAADKEVRIPRSDVEAVQPGKISIMPAGLDKQLSPQELADLIAFLRACR